MAGDVREWRKIELEAEVQNGLYCWNRWRRTTAAAATTTKTTTWCSKFRGVGEKSWCKYINTLKYSKKFQMFLKISRRIFARQLAILCGANCLLIFWQTNHICSVLTYVYFIKLNYPHMYAQCFGLYLGHLHKVPTGKCNKNSKGPLLTFTLVIVLKTSRRTYSVKSIFTGRNMQHTCESNLTY